MKTYEISSGMQPGSPGLQYAGLAASGFNTGPPCLLLLMPTTTAAGSGCNALHRKPMPPDSSVQARRRRATGIVGPPMPAPVLPAADPARR